MDTDKCYALLKVLEHHNFSKAAAELSYSPSGISRMMTALEQEVGCPLLYRNITGIYATPQCEQLLPLFRELSHWGQQITDHASALSGIQTGEVTIGVSNPAHFSWLSQAVAAFSGDYPHIKLKFFEGKSEDLYQAMGEYRADLCLVSHREKNVPWIPIIREHLVAWLPENHPKASGEYFDLKEYENYPYIATFSDEGTDNGAMFQEYNIFPDTRITTGSSYATWCLVEAGLGISLDTSETAKNWSGRVTVLPVHPERTVEIGLITQSAESLSPAAEKFIAYVQNEILSPS